MLSDVAAQVMGGDLDEAAIAAGLPSWAQMIELARCEWPLQAAAYKKLGYSISESTIDCSLLGGHSQDVAQAICEGAAERMAELGTAERLSVYSNAVETSVWQRFGEHVTLTRLMVAS